MSTRYIFKQLERFVILKSNRLNHNSNYIKLRIIENITNALLLSLTVVTFIVFIVLLFCFPYFQNNYNDNITTQYARYVIITGSICFFLF